MYVCLLCYIGICRMIKTTKRQLHLPSRSNSLFLIPKARNRVLIRSDPIRLQNNFIRSDPIRLYLKSLCEFCRDRSLLYRWPINLLAIPSKTFAVILYYYALLWEKLNWKYLSVCCARELSTGCLKKYHFYNSAAVHLKISISIWYHQRT